jgi:hypothetical protein
MRSAVAFGAGRPARGSPETTERILGLRAERSVSIGPGVTKQLRVTLIGVERTTRTALVTLIEDSSWTARAVVELHGQRIEHASAGHAEERAALLAITGWLRTRFGASTTCLGSSVTITGVRRSSATPCAG